MLYKLEWVDGLTEFDVEDRWHGVDGVDGVDRVDGGKWFGWGEQDGRDRRGPRNWHCAFLSCIDLIRHGMLCS